MGINRKIWEDTRDRVAALLPSFRPDSPFMHLSTGVDFQSIAARRDRHFKIFFDSGADYSIEMCQRALYPVKTLLVEVAYGVPNGQENSAFLADIQDDADEIVRALQMDNKQFLVNDSTGAHLIRRVHDGSMDISFSGDDDRQAVLTLGFQIQYSRP